MGIPGGGVKQGQKRIEKRGSTGVLEKMRRLSHMENGIGLLVLMRRAVGMSLAGVSVPAIKTTKVLEGEGLGGGSPWQPRCWRIQRQT